MTTTFFPDGWTYRSPVGPFAAAGGDAAIATPVRLPHDALRDADRSADVPSKGGGAYSPPGAFTYLNEFDVPADWAGKVVRLEVQGAYRRAMVFLNDEFAGNRADGYARFFVDLTPYLRFGTPNTLRIETRSGEDSRWYSGAGLHRPVLLHVDEAVHIVPDGVRVTTIRVEADQAVIEVATTVTNRAINTAQVDVVTAVTAPDGSAAEADRTPLTLAPGRTSVVRQRLYIQNPELWNVDSPSLYSVHTRLADGHSIGADDTSADDATAGITTAIGIRTVTVDPKKGLRINGEEVLLRGACVHSDNGPLGAASIARAEERRIQLLKDAGFNAIRAAHNPASPSMLDACDRLGMLVIDEAFDMWTRGKTNYDYAAEFPQWWAADLESMVAKDFNHPSVIMYSIGNEIIEVGTPHGAAWARDLAEHLREFDPTRLVTNGVNAFLAVIDELADILEADQGLNELMGDMGGGMNALSTSDAVTRRTAESSSVLDVLGLNYAEGRYTLDAELYPHRVLFGSETFPTQIGTLWPLVRDNANVIGDFTWTGWDYLGEVGIGATSYAEDPEANAQLEREYPYLTAWSGDLDITGFRRPASYYREIVFGLRSEPAIAVLRPERHGQTVTMQSPWAWSDSITSWTFPGFEGAPVTVEVYADADEVALVRDGTEVARGPVGGTRPMVATLETVYHPGVLTAIAYRDGTETGRTSLTSATGAALLTATVDRSSIRADGSDLAYVAIELRDAAGELFTGSDRSVQVDVAGAGILAGLGSGNPKTAERFDSASRDTFDGRALAIIRPTGPGSITVTVTSGDETVVLEIEAS
jgi:beta-galactosidase